MSDQRAKQPCRGCSKPIVMARNAAKALGSIPIDTSAAVYRLEERDGKPYAVLLSPSSDYGVNHFATCSKANEFSKAGEEDRKRRRTMALEAKCALVRLLGHPNVKLLEAIDVQPGAGEDPAEFGDRVRQQLWWIANKLHSLQEDLAPPKGKK